MAALARTITFRLDVSAFMADVWELQWQLLTGERWGDRARPCDKSYLDWRCTRGHLHTTRPICDP